MKKIVKLEGLVPHLVELDTRNPPNINDICYDGAELCRITGTITINEKTYNTCVFLDNSGSFTQGDNDTLLYKVVASTDSSLGLSIIPEKLANEYFNNRLTYLAN